MKNIKEERFIRYYYHLDRWGTCFIKGFIINFFRVLSRTNDNNKKQEVNEAIMCTNKKLERKSNHLLICCKLLEWVAAAIYQETFFSGQMEITHVLIMQSGIIWIFIKRKTWKIKVQNGMNKIILNIALFKIVPN